MPGLGGAERGAAAAGAPAGSGGGQAVAGVGGDQLALQIGEDGQQAGSSNVDMAVASSDRPAMTAPAQGFTTDSIYQFKGASFVAGAVGEAVAGLTIHAGTYAVHASVTNGRYLAWWPGPVFRSGPLQPSGQGGPQEFSSTTSPWPTALSWPTLNRANTHDPTRGLNRSQERAAVVYSSATAGSRSGRRSACGGVVKVYRP